MYFFVPVTPFADVMPTEQAITGCNCCGLCLSKKGRLCCDVSWNHNLYVQDVRMLDEQVMCHLLSGGRGGTIHTVSGLERVPPLKWRLEEIETEKEGLCCWCESGL